MIIINIMSKHPKKYKWQIEHEAHVQACLQQRIGYLTSQMLPGQKLLTCSICNKICIVPEHVIMISHIKASGSKIHPHSIMEY